MLKDWCNYVFRVWLHEILVDIVLEIRDFTPIFGKNFKKPLESNESLVAPSYHPEIDGQTKRVN